MITVTKADARTLEFDAETPEGKIHVHILKRRFERRADAYWAKTRIYVSLTGVDLGIEHPPFGSQKGDGSEEDKAWKAYNKAEIKGMRQLADAVREHLALITSMPQYAKFSFSRHAGCSGCPCSPGLIIQSDTSVKYDHKPVDIWVSLTKNEA